MLTLLNKLIGPVPYFSLNYINDVPGEDFLKYEYRIYVQSGTTIQAAYSVINNQIIYYTGNIPSYYFLVKNEE